MITLTLAAGVALPGVAHAQQADGASLIAMDVSSLRGELTQRYDGALAATLDPAVINAGDSRFTWASEAKVQCGIALGYLKSSTKDETSIGKCAYAYDQFMRQRAAAPPVVQAPPPTACTDLAPRLVFFEFDSAVPPASSTDVIEYLRGNATTCQWSNLDIVGHADRSGSDEYNVGLSQARAQAVADLLAAGGVDRSIMTVSARGEAEPRVPTADGVRSPENRRVEITAR